ncbi:MAG: methyltransferase domain-containing protein [Ferruginibacter sp.]
MLKSLVELLRCPVTNSKLTLVITRQVKKELDGKSTDTVDEGILYAEADWFYPIIKGIPRLTVEAVIDHDNFLSQHMTGYEALKEQLIVKYEDLINETYKKNKRTRQSFTQEWAIFDHEKDKTWDAGEEDMLQRFFRETDETAATLKNKIIFDAGCGNGLLNCMLAKNGIVNIAMDFSNSIEKAYDKNRYSKVHFIQGNVQNPPVANNHFDLVHCSGVLIHTNNTEFSFSCISALVKPKGKLSVWLYHPRKNFTHNLFNRIRKATSRLPLKFQYRLYRFTIFPISYVIKRMKGNAQNSREMMIDILDWFTPEFRWEHTHEEVERWFCQKKYNSIKITTNEVFGFNIIGIKD